MRARYMWYSSGEDSPASTRAPRLHGALLEILHGLPRDDLLDLPAARGHQAQLPVIGDRVHGLAVAREGPVALLGHVALTHARRR